MSELDLTIRDATLDDADALQRNCLPRATPEEVREGLAEALRRAPAGEGCYLVAVVDGEAVGQLALWRNAHALERHRATIQALVVCPRYRRRGIARRLVEEARVRARAMGATILEIAARGGEPAEVVYRRLGFREWGRLPGGLREPCGEGRTCDDVHLFMAPE